MKKILLILFILDITGFISGIIYIQSSNYQGRGHLLIGLSVSLLMFLIVPVFLYMRYGNKQASDFVYKKDK